MSETVVSVAMVQPASKVTAATQRAPARARTAETTDAGVFAVNVLPTTTLVMPVLVFANLHAMARSAATTAAVVPVVPATNNMSASMMGHVFACRTALERSAGRTVVKVLAAPVSDCRKFATMDNVNASQLAMAKSAATMDVEDHVGCAARARHACLTAA